MQNLLMFLIRRTRCCRNSALHGTAVVAGRLPPRFGHMGAAALAAQHGTHMSATAQNTGVVLGRRDIYASARVSVAVIWLRAIGREPRFRRDDRARPIDSLRPAALVNGPMILKGL